MDIVKADIFSLLTTRLNKASDFYLGVDGPGEAFMLSDNIHRYISTDLYFVLDEAQRPARLFTEAYRSGDTSMARPILREIVSAWNIKGYIIISGTGLSEKEVQDARILKADPLRKLVPSIHPKHSPAIFRDTCHPTYFKVIMASCLIVADYGGN